MKLNNKYIRRILREAIEESLGISDKVKEVSNSILRAALNGETHVKMDDIDICLSYESINFKNFGEYERWVETNHRLAFSFIKFHKVITFGNLYFKLIFINGKLDYTETLNSIYHEVEHIFQQIKQNKSFGNEKDNSKYSKVDIPPTNKYEQFVWTVKYLSFRYEIDGEINGLYGSLNGCVEKGETPKNKHGILGIIKESDIFKKMNVIKDGLSLIKTNPKEITKALVRYGYNEPSLEKLELKATHILNAVKFKIWRLITKFMEDYNINN